MSKILYLVGIDPGSSKPISSVPAMLPRFDGAPVFASADYVRGCIAAGQPCRLHTDAAGFDRMRHILEAEPRK